MAGTPSDPQRPPSHSPQFSPLHSNPTSPKPLLTYSPHKKPQPLPWSHEETTNLIQAYQEKWYSLKRGQLKASQWEEVAITVAARCGYDEPTKTATQCRHKIEKLRKRYRTEKQRLGPGRQSPWPFFAPMDGMERGPLPISARPMSMIDQYDDNSGEPSNNDEDHEEEDSDEDDDRFTNKSRSINYILRRPTIVNRFAADRKFSEDAKVGGEFSGFPKRGEVVAEEGEGEGRGRRVVSEMAAEIRSFAERFVKMENKKIEMMRESQRDRLEMENKRMEMILDSQRKIVDTINRAFGSQKKMKMTQES